MISGTAVFVVRWLAPIMFLASIFLSIFSFVGPVPTTHHVALIAVTPMNSEMMGASRRDISSFAYAEGAEGRRVPRAALFGVLSATTDGASAFIGPLGSCAKAHNADQLTCQSANWDATYDYSLLPSNAPKTALPPSPPSTSPPFYLTAIIISTLFFLLTFVASLADLLPSAPAALATMNTHPGFNQGVTSLGMLGFIMTLLTALVWRISFGRDVQEFNIRIAVASGSPALVASLSNGFTMIWISLGFQAPLLACQFFKLHMEAISNGKA
ncbi:hypothetical protein DL93DRAFT_2156884 [Clavulina sp. PMI_390]|nr:hypothetical protein DL93DRAFT_2156884 [Clavulina sp. PMI_390]